MQTAGLKNDRSCFQVSFWYLHFLLIRSECLLCVTYISMLVPELPSLVRWPAHVFCSIHCWWLLDSTIFHHRVISNHLKSPFFTHGTPHAQHQIHPPPTCSSFCPSSSRSTSPPPCASKALVFSATAALLASSGSRATLAEAQPANWPRSPNPKGIGGWLEVGGWLVDWLVGTVGRIDGFVEAILRSTVEPRSQRLVKN